MSPCTAAAPSTTGNGQSTASRPASAARRLVRASLLASTALVGAPLAGLAIGLLAPSPAAAQATAAGGTITTLTTPQGRVYDDSAGNGGVQINPVTAGDTITVNGANLTQTRPNAVIGASSRSILLFDTNDAGGATTSVIFTGTTNLSGTLTNSSALRFTTTNGNAVINQTGGSVTVLNQFGINATALTSGAATVTLNQAGNSFAARYAGQGIGVGASSGGLGSASVTTAGTITGFATAIDARSSGGAITVTNAATLTNNTTGIYTAGAAANVTNTGAISGGSTAVQLDNGGTFTNFSTISLAGGTAVTFGSGGTVTLRSGSSTAGNISFTGGGPGNLMVDAGATLSGGTYSGVTTLTNDGTVSLSGRSLSIGTLASTTTSGVIQNMGGTAATLAVASGSYAGTVQDGGGSSSLSLTKTGAGTLTLTGANAYSGGTVIAAGTLVGSATSFGTGPIANGAALVIDQATTARFANAVSGTGTLTKTGAGTLDLTGTSTLTGPTTVAAGRLVVNGSLAGSPVTVQSGASLGGTGVIGGLVAGNGSVIAPGNSIGQLNVAGNVTFGPGSTYQVEVNAAGQGDRILAAGAATLQGGTVQVLAEQGNYLPQTRYVILTAAAGISGQFGAAFTNLAFLVPELVYDPANVTLVLTRNNLGFAGAAATRNQANAAGAAEALGQGRPVYDALVGATAAEARAGFDLISGEVHAHVVTALFQDSDLVRQAVLGRLRDGAGFGFGQAGFGLGQGGTVEAAYSAGRPGPLTPVAVPGLDPTVFGLWGQGFGAWGRDRTDRNAASLDRNTAGFVLGADATLDGQGRVGLAGGYQRTALDLDARLSSGTIESGFGAAYAGALVGPVALRAGLAYAGHQVETTRSVLIRSFADRTRAEYDASTAQAFGEAGYRLDLGRVDLGLVSGRSVLEPFVGGAAIRISTDRFAETGVAAALTGFGRTYDLGTLSLGLRSETQLGEGSPVVLRSMLGWRGAFGDTDPLALQAFRFSNTDTAPFAVAAVPIDRSSFVSETGLDWRFAAQTSLGVSYAAAVGERNQDHAVKGRFEYRF